MADNYSDSDDECDGPCICKKCIFGSDYKKVRIFSEGQFPKLSKRVFPGYKVFGLEAEANADVIKLISRMDRNNDFFPLEAKFDKWGAICIFQTKNSLDAIVKFLSEQDDCGMMIDTLGRVMT